MQRPTEEGSGPVVAEPAPPALEVRHVDERTLRPGVVPARWAGRKAKCFYVMAKAFLGVQLMGRPAEAETVHQELVGNPAFARACGFTLPVRRDPRLAVEYAASAIPISAALYEVGGQYRRNM